MSRGIGSSHGQLLDRVRQEFSRLHLGAPNVGQFHPFFVRDEGVTVPKVKMVTGHGKAPPNIKFRTGADYAPFGAFTTRSTSSASWSRCRDGRSNISRLAWSVARSRISAHSAASFRNFSRCA